MSSTHETLSEAYADAAPANDRRRDERVAAGFVPSDQFERFADMIDEDSERFEKLPLQVRLATAAYAEQRAAARRVQDTDA